MLSANHCGQLIPTKKSSFGFLHTNHLFRNKNPNFYQTFRILPVPNSISCLLQTRELNPQAVKDSLDNQEPKQQEEVELYTVNYLKNACGLSEGDALCAAKRLMVKNKRLSEMNRAANADAVLALFREHGLSGTQISKAVNKHPFILIARPYKTILPKLDFLQSIGFTRGAYIAEIISGNPEILSSSLKCKLIPNYNILKEVLNSNHELIHAALKKDMRIMQSYHTRNMVSNVEVLRNAGVFKSRIAYLVVNYPVTVRQKHSQFRQAVIQLKEMGFDPSRDVYIYGVIALLRNNKIGWDRCYEKFLELGCSRDEILSAFRTRPLSLLLSVEKINKMMDCLVNKMGWPHSDIANKPYLFRHSLEKRIIPRCSVVLYLHSKGLLEKLPKGNTVLEGSEEYFIKRYVTKFAKVVPEVLQIYKGELNFLGKQEK